MLLIEIGFGGSNLSAQIDSVLWDLLEPVWQNSKYYPANAHADAGFCTSVWTSPKSTQPLRSLHINRLDLIWSVKWCLGDEFVSYHKHQNYIDIRLISNLTRFVVGSTGKFCAQLRNLPEPMNHWTPLSYLGYAGPWGYTGIYIDQGPGTYPE